MYNGIFAKSLMAHFTNDLEAVRVAVGMAVITTFDAAVMSIMVIIKMIIYVVLRSDLA